MSNYRKPRFAVRLLALAILPFMASCYGADEFVFNGTFQFASTSVSVAEGGGTVTVTIQRTGSADGDVTVTFAASDGSATDASDYVATTGVLNWASGDMSDRNVAFTINQDLLVEGSENFTVTLSQPTGGAEIGAASSTSVSITDDDSPSGAIQFSSATYSRSESGATVTITLTRTGGSIGAVSVDYNTADGSALGGTDYSTTAATQAWGAADSVDKTFTVAITADTDIEGDENFSINLSNATGGATIGTPSSTVVTILDDDIPGTLQFTASTTSVNESGGTVPITVSRVGGIGGAASVQYATANGSAIAGTDYTGIGLTTLNWASGDGLSQTFNVTITPDFLIQGDLDFSIVLSNATGAALGTPSTIVVTIQEDDAPGTLQFSASSASVNENVTTITLMVTRTGGVGGTVTVDFATANGTATAGSDYVATSGTLTWTPGDGAAKPIIVTITDDITNEGNETFTATLTNPTGSATLGTPVSETVTITDNDIFGTLQFSSATYSGTETGNGGIVTITVQRIGGPTGAVSVNFATSPGTANGADYFGTNGTLNWAAGDGADKTFTVTLKNNDNQAEGDETVNLTLSAPTGGAILGTPSTAVLTIIND